MKKFPNVSVIITCYNSREHINTSIESVINQTYNDLECIIVDDGSEDNTKEIVRRFVEQDNRVKYFYKENGGASSARNYGINIAKGKWIQFLDDDDWLYDKKLEKQLEYVKNRNSSYENIIIYSDWDVYREDDEGELHFEREVIVGNLSKEELIKWFVENKPPRLPPFSISSTLISKNIFNKYRFNEEFFNLEEVCLYYKLLNDNVNCIYVPIKSMCYRKNNTGISRNKYSFVKGYACYLETIYSVNKHHLKLNHRFSDILKDTIKCGNKEAFNKYLFILYNSKIPVYANLRGKTVNVRTLAVLVGRFHLLQTVIKFGFYYEKFKRRIYRQIKKYI